MTIYIETGKKLKEEKVWSTISDKTRSRIEAQGFAGIKDWELMQINYWLRLAPAICMTWTAVGLILASPLILWALTPFALLGGILRGHPFDIIYNYGFRFLFKTPKLPPYALPRRFACLLAWGFLTIAAMAFQFGMPVIGYIFGGFMVIAAFTNVSTGFCVPSFIYGLIFGKTICEIRPKYSAHN